MADKPWSVAFAGTGETSEANVKELLDDWLPQKLEHVTVPDRIGRSHKGLKRVKAWLDGEIGEKHVGEAAVSTSGDGLDLGALLGVHQAEGCDPYLVYIPAEEWDEESDEAKLVRMCIAADIPVKDLTAGLDDYEPPAPQEPAEEAKTVTRGKPRNPSSEAVEEAVEAAKDSVRDTLAGIGVHPETAAKGTVTVTLSQPTIDALLAAFAALAGDVKAAVQADLPGAAKPKTYPFWVNEDGEYRPRTGRGRPKNGEQKADLTEAEVKELGLELSE